MSILNEFKSLETEIRESVKEAVIKQNGYVVVDDVRAKIKIEVAQLGFNCKVYINGKVSRAVSFQIGGGVKDAVTVSALVLNTSDIDPKYVAIDPKCVVPKVTRYFCPIAEAEFVGLIESAPEKETK